MLIASSAVSEVRFRTYLEGFQAPYLQQYDPLVYLDRLYMFGYLGRIHHC
jgi:hypothetical protein